MSVPIDDAADTPVTLSQRAPAGPIPTTERTAYVSYGTRHLDYGGLLVQRNPCIRSLEQRRAVKVEAHWAERLTQLSSSYQMTESGTFPYPKAYQELLFPPNPSQRPDEEDGTLQNENIDGGRAPREQLISISWGFSISTPFFGFSRMSEINVHTRTQPTYVVLGLFLCGSTNPKERVVFVDKPEQLFSKLRWETFRLRGMRRLFLSLKHLKGFRLYKCDAGTGTHKRITLDANSTGDLQLLMSTYKRWHVPGHISEAWSDWIHCTLNNNRLDILEGEYGLELVLDWSVTRISIVVLVPVLLSLAIGIWLNSKAWTDLATIQTAWGTASYIVTAGALLAAMLGFLDIADR